MVKVEGFTIAQAKKFASRILSDANQVHAVLTFNPTQHPDTVPLYKSPILLSFLCLLAREDDIDLSSAETVTGEIYTRLMRCLYKKYCIRKGSQFDPSKLTTAMRLIGRLALKTLLSGNPLMKRSDVIREVGEDAFDYGILIGYVDFRLILDESADILITFGDISIQEYFGALYFTLSIDEGFSIESLLGSDCKKPIFLMNPLFLNFCLWFVSADPYYFNLNNGHCVYKQLLNFTTNLINPHDEIDAMLTSYPSLGSQDELIARFRADICSTLGIKDVPHKPNRKGPEFDERSYEMYAASTSTEHTGLTSEATSKKKKSFVSQMNVKEGRSIIIVTSLSISNSLQKNINTALIDPILESDQEHIQDFSLVRPSIPGQRS